MAAVFCASFSRCGDGAAQPGHLHALLARPRPRAARCAARRRRGGRRRGGSRNASTSPLVMRPSLPVPAPICAGVDAAAPAISLRRRPAAARCAGARRPAASPARRDRAGAARRRVHARRGGAGAPARLRRRGLAAARRRAVADQQPSSAPTSTSAPSRHAISASVPAAGAFTSTRHLVGLQLDQRLVGRHRVARPASASARRWPSVTLSPSAGTLISVAIVRPVRCRLSIVQPQRQRACVHQRRLFRGMASWPGRWPGSPPPAGRHSAAAWP